MSNLRAKLLRATVLATAVWLGACQAEGSQDPPDGGTTDAVNRYLMALPPWHEFSPPLAPHSPRPTGESPARFQASLEGVQLFGADGGAVGVQRTYVCQRIPYTLTENPESLVMFSPDLEVLWPGALIQGRSHRDGLGSLLPLPIGQRKPIKVSIPSLPTGENFREVNPTQAEVASAIGAMIGQATRRELSTSSSVLFQMRAYRSEAEFALSGKLSGRYLGFHAKASATVSTSAAETTVAVQFFHKMFEVVVESPQTPGVFFRDDFTEERLAEQLSLGRLGPDNLPVFVSNVVYGRMMMFALTSTAEESDIRGALNAAYRTAVAGGGLELSAKHRKILETARISVLSVGGDAANAEAMIRSGDWRSYFQRDTPLSSATPLSYTLRNLADGKIAVVSETARYNITQCGVKTEGGFFGFLSPIEDDKLPLPAPYSPQVGDFNGDGRDDIVWNHLGPSRNALYLGFGQPGAAIQFTSPWQHPEKPGEGWPNYELLVGDLNGDGKDDLIWNHLAPATASGSPRNVVYTALSNGDGTFQPGIRQEHPATSPRYGWLDFGKVVADLDGDGDEDLAWTSGSGEALFYLARSNPGGLLALSATPERPCPGLPVGRVVVAADANGDGRSDLLWLVADEGSDGSTGLDAVATSARADGSFECVASPVLRYFPEQVGWPEVAAADHDADGRSDLLVHFKGNGLHVEVRHGSSWLSYGSGCSASWSGVPGLRGPFFGDFNGDGREDFVFEGADSSPSVKRLWVALAGPAPACYRLHSPEAQLHPTRASWELAKRLIADLNGDGRDELIYNFTEATNRLLVAVAW